MLDKEFSGEDFAKALSEGTLKEPLVRVGMVKRGEHPDTILFSEDLQCWRWVSIPAKTIEKVRWLAKVPCHDHIHDLVWIQLREPKDPEALVFADLLRSSDAAAGHRKSCEWGGRQYSPGAWIPVAHGHFCYRYYCQPDGSWRKDGLCV
jgi:hypothetical protein